MAAAGLLLGERRGAQGADVGELGGDVAGLDVAARHADQRGTRLEVVDDDLQDRRRCLVHPVDVLEDDEDRRRERVVEEERHHLVHALAPELGRERGGVRGVREVDVERGREQREPRRELGAALVDDFAQPHLDQLGRGRLGQAEQVVEEPPERCVRRGGLVRVARDDEGREVAGAGAQLLDEPALADAGVADDLDRPPVPGAQRVERLVEHGDLVVAADEGKVRRAARDAALHRAERERLDRLALALHDERLERLGVEGGAGAVEHRARREDLAGLGARHEPGGEVHRVAHDGVRAAVAGADVAREDRAAVHADAHPEPAGAVGDVAHRAEHPLFVVTHRARDAGDEDDLAAVVVDVGAEERDLVLVGRALHVGDELVERFGDVGRAFALEELVGAVEVEERDGRLTVLRVLAAGQQVRADRGGDVAARCPRCGCSAGRSGPRAAPSRAERAAAGSRVRAPHRRGPRDQRRRRRARRPPGPRSRSPPCR